MNLAYTAALCRYKSIFLFRRANGATNQNNLKNGYKFHSARDSKLALIHPGQKVGSRFILDGVTSHCMMSVLWCMDLTEFNKSVNYTPLALRFLL